jgi:hypothetical protein
VSEDPTLAARLAEAEDALHQLTIGRAVVEIGAETERVKYAQADRAQLAAYVRSLRVQLGRTPRGGAIGVAFR